jgi:aryl-alcohol dehydrogenase-like predicted oxidoreductase
MRHHALGRTGLFVSELCLGTMTFGGSDGMWRNIGALPQGDAERLVGQAIDAGINFIDTADVYAAGMSEQITGQALRNLKIPRDDVVIATKVFGEMGKGPNSRGATRHHIIDGVKASLRRLQLEHIDLYQIHGFDPATPIDETVRALDQVVRDGHVRYRCIELGSMANCQGLRPCRALGFGTFRIAASLLQRGGSGSGAGTHSHDEERRTGSAGVESAGGRLIERQIHEQGSN